MIRVESANHAAVLLGCAVAERTTRSMEPVDADGCPARSLVETSTQTVLNSHAYQYNTAHQRTRQTLPEGNYWDYGHDALGQLTSAKGTVTP